MHYISNASAIHHSSAGCARHCGLFAPVQVTLHMEQPDSSGAPRTAEQTHVRRSQRLVAKRRSPVAFGTSYKVIDATSLGASHKDARQDVTKAHRNAGMCRRSAKKRRDDPELSGFLAGLPQELLDDILDRCTAVQLAQLETTCLFFKATKIVQNTAESKLKAVPRAKGLAPNKRAMETWSTLLHFITSQSTAAAQATAIAFGANHTAALLTKAAHDNTKDGHHSLYTVGRGFYGQLGHGDFASNSTFRPLCLGYQPSVDVPGMEEEVTPAVVTCGTDNSAAITRRGQLFTWGLGNRGELGHDQILLGEVPFPARATLFSRPTIRVVSAACGSNHTLAIAENGSLWSCGRNHQGQLGNGVFEDNLQLSPVAGIRGARIVAAAAGACHSMALASDGSLYTWGHGAYGQLGHVALEAVQAVMPQQTIVLPVPKKIACLNPGSLEPANRVTAIAGGKHHSMAVTVGGRLMGFGRNTSGELGTGDTINRWGPTDIKFSRSKEPECVYRTAQVTCGANHSLALVTYRGKLTTYATGANGWGELGLGDQHERTRFERVRGLHSIVALQAGEHNSAAIGANGSVHLWGRNDCGQLGVGTDRSSFKPVLLPNFRAVHPDRTLRKNKRSLPRMRAVESQSVGRKSSKTPASKHAFFFAASGATPQPGVTAKKPNATPCGSVDGI
eukprot:jgi/Chrzof1/7137/Cz02g12140.t1